MSDDGDIHDTREEALEDAKQFAEDTDGDVTITSCAGPPLCMLEGEEAIQRQIDGCPLCRRDIRRADGTWYTASVN